MLAIRAAERVKRQNAETEIPIGVFKAMRAEEFGKLMVMVFASFVANDIRSTTVVKTDTKPLTRSFHIDIRKPLVADR